MERYITLYWQSLDLMQAGMDSDTADYVYVRIDGAPRPRPRTDADRFPANLIPAWSFGRLWDIFVEKGWTFDYTTNVPAADVMRLMVETLIDKLRYEKKANNTDNP